MTHTTAQVLLEEFWNCQLPIDPAYIAQRLGLAIKYSRDLGLKSSYLHVENKEICVNASECLELQRFSIAHELGHYCLGHGSSFRDPNDSQWIQQYDPQKELLADQFAADLLMPSLAMKAVIDIRGEKDPVKLRKMFCVSSSAMFVRLKELGYAHQ